MNMLQTFRENGCLNLCKSRGSFRLKDGDPCPVCDGLDIYVDFEPILARPCVLRDVVECFLDDVGPGIIDSDMRSQLYGHTTPLAVVGPINASHLVYEFARRLKGLAIDIEQSEDGQFYTTTDIPKDAKVLFVTDKLRDPAPEWIIALCQDRLSVFPWLFCLANLTVANKFCTTSVDVDWMHFVSALNRNDIKGIKNVKD